MFQWTGKRKFMDRVHKYMVQDYVEAYLTLWAYSMHPECDEAEISGAMKAFNKMSEELLIFKKKRGMHTRLLNLDGFIKPDGTMNLFTLARYRANKGFGEFDMDEIEEAFNYASYFLQKKKREGNEL